jgi:NAD(P)-dependent dehydrogenase (short-subunit alcohol dehydrogenase family)
MDLTGKTVLITGAKGGLGSFVTQAFLDAGARVAGVSRSMAASDFDHPHFAPYAADLAGRAEAMALVERVQHGLGRLDAVVHLVGGWAGGRPLHAADDGEYQKMFDVNFRSAVHLFQAALPVLRAQGGGRLLAVGSRAAVEPSPGSALYAASKAALVSLIRTLAAENKDRGITANIILPGTLDTPANRAAMPGANFAQWVPPPQVASLLVHLTSDDASHVTGAAIPILGGEA